MNLNEYQELAMRTEKPLNFHKKLLHVVTLLPNEVGELCGAIKKAEVYGQPMDFKNIEEELGDLLWAIAYAANVFGMSLEVCAMENIAKLRRRYPDGYSDYHAQARLDKHE